MKKLKWSLYLHYFFDDFIFIYPFYSLYFQENGIKGTSFSFLMMIWVLSVMLFELPSGVIADKYSRKHIIMFGEFVRIIGYAVWILYPTFIGFAFGFIAWGFKSALRSGAIDAIIYDNLLVLNEPDEFEHIMVRAKFLQSVSIIVVTLLSSYLVRYDFQFLIYLSLGSLLVSILALIGVQDLRLEKTNLNMKQIFHKGFQHLKSRKVVYLIMLGQSFYIMGMLDEYWGLFSYEIGFELSTIALIIVSLMVLESITLWFVPKLKHLPVVGFIAIGGLIVMLTVNLNPWVAIIGVGVANALFKALSLVVDVKFQHAFQADVRATVTSVKGFLDEIFCIMFYGVLALLAHYFDYIHMFYYAAMITVVIGVLVGLYGKKTAF